MKKVLALLFALLPAFAYPQAYGVFQPGGDLTGTWNTQTVASGAITLSKMANLSGPSIIGSATAGSNPPSALLPLQAANLMSAMLSVSCINTTATTLPSLGPGSSLDCGTAVAGQTILFTALNSSGNTSANGVYVIPSTAHTLTNSDRAQFFTGTVPQNCDLVIFVKNGSSSTIGTLWRLVTTASGGVVIGTSNQNWVAVSPARATNAAFGAVQITDPSTSPTGLVASSLGGGALNAGDCVSFYGDLNGSIGDLGNVPASATSSGPNNGPCVVTDATGHPYFPNPAGAAPTSITKTGTTLGTQVSTSDTRGKITGNTALTAIVITFLNAWPYAPACGSSIHATTGSVPATTDVNSSTSSVTFTFSAAFTGDFNYWCF